MMAQVEQSTSVLIIDCETTGIGSNDEPISIGLISLVIDGKGGAIGEPVHYEGFRYPKMSIHPKAQAVHGMSRESLIGKAFDDAVINQMICSAEVLIAHNADFDARMIGKLYPAVIEKSWRCSYRQWPWPDETENKKLDSICKLFSVERPATHGALKDAKALLECLLQRTGKTERSATYLKKLIDRSEFSIRENQRDTWRQKSSISHGKTASNKPIVRKEVSKLPMRFSYIVFGLAFLFLLHKCS